MAEHTSLPWRTSEIGTRMMIRGADAKIVAVRHRIDRREHEENFELIVKAVNAWYDVEVLRQRIAELEAK